MQRLRQRSPGVREGPKFTHCSDLRSHKSQDQMHDLGTSPNSFLEKVRLSQQKQPRQEERFFIAVAELSGPRRQPGKDIQRLPEQKGLASSRHWAWVTVHSAWEAGLTPGSQTALEASPPGFRSPHRGRPQPAWCCSFLPSDALCPLGVFPPRTL